MKIGLEIHQQLKTSKLFCRCPSVLREVKPDVIVERRLRAVASETGARDITSETEFAKGRKFIYQAYSDSTCLIEIDEAPPKEINPEALQIACTIAGALNCRVVPELHVMRKAIIDGSCPSSFQRTALLAKDGFVEARSGKKIRIESICIEEDAGRIIASDNSSATFRVDRLGIPLVEITTAPEIESPEEAREVAERIGTVLRLTGKVVRGLGSIRQDLNVSVPEGARVEIKGVQQLDQIPELVRMEAERQKSLAGIAKKYSDRIIAIERAGGPKSAEVTEVFLETGCKLLAGLEIHAAILPGLAGILDETLHEGKRFGKEVAERMRILTTARGFLHTDELPAYGVTAEEVRDLRAATGAGENDLICLVAGKGPEAHLPLMPVVERILLSNLGVPGETRKANPDCSTSFLRPISGSSRFYPETDVAPAQMGPVRADSVESPEERMGKLEKLGLPEKLAKGLLLSENYPLFLLALEKRVQPVLAATIVEETLPYLRRKGIEIDRVPDSDYSVLFELVSSGKLPREGIPDAMEKLARHEGISKLAEAGRVSEAQVAGFARKLIFERREYILKEGAERAISGLMGELMKEFKGKFSGTLLKEILSKELLGNA
ncbi:MAG: Glu-tRNA(Gln) amidotransferase subunit GatE [archaeon]